MRALIVGGPIAVHKFEAAEPSPDFNDGRPILTVNDPRDSVVAAIAHSDRVCRTYCTRSIEAGAHRIAERIAVSQTLADSDRPGERIGGRGDHWRRCVHRLARVFLTNERQEGEHFLERHCLRCGCSVMADRRIYPPNEYVLCEVCKPAHERLYDPTAAHRRDGYWYAACLIGKDPEGPSTQADDHFDALYEHYAYLQRACADVGLEFGTVLSLDYPTLKAEPLHHYLTSEPSIRLPVPCAHGLGQMDINHLRPGESRVVRVSHRFVRVTRQP